QTVGVSGSRTIQNVFTSGGAWSMTFTHAVSAWRILPSARISAMTFTSAPGARAWSRPSGVTHTFVVSEEWKVGAGNPFMGSPSRFDGVGTRRNVSWGETVERLIARWFNVTPMNNLLASVTGSNGSGIFTSPHPPNAIAMATDANPEAKR